jgi:hypothetical protein
VASPTLLRVRILFLPALLNLPPCFPVPLRQFHAKLPRQVQRRLDGAAEALDRGVHVRDITVKVASEAVDMVAVEVHGLASAWSGATQCALFAFTSEW